MNKTFWSFDTNAKISTFHLFLICSLIYRRSHRSSKTCNICCIIKGRTHSHSHHCQGLRLSLVASLAEVFWCESGPQFGRHLRHYTVRQQWIRYQSEEIPTEWTEIHEEACKPTVEHDSYWSDVEKGWIGDSVSSDKPKQLPIDQYWHKVGTMKNDDRTPKYPQLLALVKCCLSLFHGNATPERGFSINKRILETHGASLSENCLIALRRTKDSIIRHGGSLNITITPDLLKSVENSYLNYTAHVEAKRKAEIQRTEMQSWEDENRKRRDETMPSELNDVECEIKEI